MSNIAIKVEGLGKKYKIGRKESSNFRESLTNLFKKNTSKIPAADSSNTHIIKTIRHRITNDFWALKDIDFEIKQGEAVGIIGRNGAGKSTLLKILSRITKPTTGRFEIAGRVSSLLEVGTGFHMELTGRENIYLNGTILGMRRREIKAKFEEMVAFSGVEDFIDTPVKHYSSGMKVRLAFSVAAHLEPEILIIDEVLAVGDAEFQKKCLGKMEDVTGKGRTVLFVSHNMEAIERLCFSSILLEQGMVICNDNTKAVIEKYLISNRPEPRSALNNYRVNEFVMIEKFQINKGKYLNTENCNYEIQFSHNLINKLNGLALLFFDSMNRRIAVIDLRTEELITKSKTSGKLRLYGEFSVESFLSGHYAMGIYLDSSFFHGNLENLLEFEVVDTKESAQFIPYPKSVSGFFKINHINKN